MDQSVFKLLSYSYLWSSLKSLMQNAGLTDSIPDRGRIIPVDVIDLLF